MFLPWWMTPQHHLDFVFFIPNIQWTDNSCWFHYIYIAVPSSPPNPTDSNLIQVQLISTLDNFFNSLLKALRTLVSSYVLTIPSNALNPLLPNQIFFFSLLKTLHWHPITSISLKVVWPLNLSSNLGPYWGWDMVSFIVTLVPRADSPGQTST